MKEIELTPDHIIDAYVAEELAKLRHQRPIRVIYLPSAIEDIENILSASDDENSSRFQGRRND